MPSDHFEATGFSAVRWEFRGFSARTDLPNSPDLVDALEKWSREATSWVDGPSSKGRPLEPRALETKRVRGEFRPMVEEQHGSDGRSCLGVYVGTEGAWMEWRFPEDRAAPPTGADFMGTASYGSGDGEIAEGLSSLGGADCLMARLTSTAVDREAIEKFFRSVRAGWRPDSKPGEVSVIDYEWGFLVAEGEGSRPFLLALWHPEDSASKGFWNFVRTRLPDQLFQAFKIRRWLDDLEEFRGFGGELIDEAVAAVREGGPSSKIDCDRVLDHVEDLASRSSEFLENASVSYQYLDPRWSKAGFFRGLQQMLAKGSGTRRVLEGWRDRVRTLRSEMENHHAERARRLEYLVAALAFFDFLQVFQNELSVGWRIGMVAVGVPVLVGIFWSALGRRAGRGAGSDEAPRWSSRCASWIAENESRTRLLLYVFLLLMLGLVRLAIHWKP